MKGKIFSVFACLLYFISTMQAQDIITKVNGDEIQAKVTEVNTDDVKYKKFSNQSGPAYIIQKSDIFMIKYEDGSKDLFEKNPTTGSTSVRHVANPDPDKKLVQEQAKEKPKVLPGTAAASTQEPPESNPFDARKGEYDIIDLIENKIVEVEVTGRDITYVNVRIRRLVSYPVNARVPVGSYFVSANPSAQNMVATAEKKIALATSSWQNLSVSAACANRPKDIPDSKDSFTIVRSPHQEELIALMPVLNKANVGITTKQAAVWIITDNADYDDLGILINQYSARMIGSSEAARAMKICSDAGIDITQKNIWRDRPTILNNLPEGTLKNWLKSGN